MKVNTKMTRPVLAGLALTLLACSGLGRTGAVARAAESPNTVSTAQDTASTRSTPAIEPAADRILRAMSEYLAAAQEYTLHAEVAYDVLVDTTQMIQYGGSADVAVRRPGQLRAEYRGDERRSSVVFDGRTATVLDRATNLYSVTEVPAGLDAAVDHVFDTYGFSVPIADFVYADPYATLTEYVDTGFWVGLHEVDGTRCHHLAFSQEFIDWQIWIEDGPRPVPRMLVITYKDEPGSPQYTARLSGWDFHPRISDRYFTFTPPVGASEIEFLAIPEDVPAVETEAGS